MSDLHGMPAFQTLGSVFHTSVVGSTPGNAAILSSRGKIAGSEQPAALAWIRNRARTLLGLTHARKRKRDTTVAWSPTRSSPKAGHRPLSLRAKRDTLRSAAPHQPRGALAFNGSVAAPSHTFLGGMHAENARTEASARQLPRRELRAEHPGAAVGESQDDRASLVDGLLDLAAGGRGFGIDERRVLRIGRLAGDRKLDRFVHRSGRGGSIAVGGQLLRHASIIAV